MLYKYAQRNIYLHFFDFFMIILYRRIIAGDNTAFLNHSSDLITDEFHSDY